MASSVSSPRFSVARSNADSYSSVPGLVCLVYDHALTFEDEVRLVWRARWTVVKFAFLFVSNFISQSKLPERELMHFIRKIRYFTPIAIAYYCGVAFSRDPSEPVWVFQF